MKKTLLSVFTLVGICISAQEKVKVHNGLESYVTTIEYLTFDALDDDNVVSVSELQELNDVLISDKKALQEQVSTLTSEKLVLSSDNESLKMQISTLTSENNTLISEKTNLEGQIEALTNEVNRLPIEIKESLIDIFEKTGTLEHDYVDLGLTSGTLWATCNVGAEKPEEYGSYFDCWDPSKDVAADMWGGNWQMPTRDMLYELSNECYWVWTDTYNSQNVSGYIVYKAKGETDKGQKNTPSTNYNVTDDVHIFLPAAGFLSWFLANNAAGYSCNYWSRDYNTELAFKQTIYKYYAIDINNDMASRSVRPIVSIDE